MDNSCRYNLITKDLAEVLGTDELIRQLETNDKFTIYWGTSPTGKPHIGYLVPLIKLAHFLKANCRVLVLFADLHAYLDNLKTSWELLKYRTEYYEIIIKKLLEILGVDTSHIFFVKGSDFQLTPRYSIDVYKMLSKVSLRDAQRAGTEVVKQCEDPSRQLMSSLIYPCLQALDEEYLNVDAQFGGIDQRKIFTMSQEVLPTLGYKKRIHLMNPMIPSFNRISSGGKMSSSDSDSKIDLLDSDSEISRKLNKGFCQEGNVIENPLLIFCKYVVFPILELKNISGFIITRPLKFGGDISFRNYDELEKTFYEKLLHPSDLKKALSQFLIDLLKPLREHCNSLEIQSLIKKAYPL
jgi:tyrosyl-tRNA synthetase